jgi:multicomponent K+:H+ antiporter subunit C
MEILYATCVGVLVACGVFLILRARTFTVVLGLTMLSYAVNLFLFSSGRLSLNQPAVLGYSTDYADPLPQALVLTAIVIGFAMTAFVVILSIRGKTDLGSDHVDGHLQKGDHIQTKTDDTPQKPEGEA